MTRPEKHKVLLVRLVVLQHVLIALLVVIVATFPSFDSSADVVVTSIWQKALLRWDVFHFLHVAQIDYAFEHEYAFLPVLHILMQAYAKLREVVSGIHEITPVPFLLTGHLAVYLAGIGSVQALYDLTLNTFKSPAMALLASVLSLLSSSPATLRFAPYAEPFFTFFSYKGMLYCSERRFFRASLYLMCASMFRANGVLLSGFIVWGMLVEPFVLEIVEQDSHWRSLNVGKFVKCVGLSSLPVIPFVWHQYEGYKAFCSSDEPRPWCGNRLPSIYSFVQSEYWNVGLFRYWTIAQVPNFVLAFPVLALLVSCALRDLSRAHILISSVQSRDRNCIATPLAIVPHAIHAILLASILMFAAHTQIALRLAAALPYTYWSAASLFVDTFSIFSSQYPFESKEVGKRKGVAATCWVWWSALWGAISLITWATFLPPA